MKDFIDSIFNHFSERLKTQVYGILAFWWVVLHGEFFFTLLFVDEDKIYDKHGLLKNEYLAKYYLNFDDPNFWGRQLLLFALAAALTYLMIWILPKYVLARAFRKEKEHEAEKRRIKIDLEKQDQVLQAQLAEASTKKLEAAEQKVKTERKVSQTDPAIVWSDEFERLKPLGVYTYFDQLIKSLYEYGGRVATPNGGFRLDRDLLAYADANELIEYNRTAGRISLTDKGKYFVKRYQNEQEQ